MTREWAIVISVFLYCVTWGFLELQDMRDSYTRWDYHTVRYGRNDYTSEALIRIDRKTGETQRVIGISDDWKIVR